MEDERMDVTHKQKEMLGWDGGKQKISPGAGGSQKRDPSGHKRLPRREKVPELVVTSDAA